jgi:hypothetical protein
VTIDDPERVEEEQRGLDPRNPGTDSAEVIDTLALREGKAAMVTANAVDRPLGEPRPEL